MIKLFFVSSLLQDFKACLTKGYQAGIIKAPSVKQLEGQIYSGKSLNYDYDYLKVFQAAQNQSKSLLQKYENGNYTPKEIEIAREVLLSFSPKDVSDDYKRIKAQSIMDSFLHWDDIHYGKNHHKEKISFLYTNSNAHFYF